MCRDINCNVAEFSVLVHDVRYTCRHNKLTTEATFRHLDNSTNNLNLLKT